MSENKIQIVSQYTDLATAKMKASFAEQEAAADRLTQAIERMSANMERSITASGEKTTEAIKGIGKSLNETKKPTDDHIGGMARMTKAYEHFRIEVARTRNAVLLFTFVFRPLINLVKESIESYTKQEDAVNRMNAALQIQGTFTDMTSKHLIGLAESLQQVTRYGDDAIENVIQRLVSEGDLLPSQLDAATKAVLDFSAATGRDLSTSADVVAKAMAGFTGQLARYGIFIDRNIPKTEKAAAVLKALNEQFGGFAQKDVNTTSGRFAKLANTVDDLKESFGRWAVGVLQVDKAIQFLNDGLKAMTPTGEESRFVELEKQADALDKAITRMQKKRSGKIVIEGISDLLPIKQLIEGLHATDGAYDSLLVKREMMQRAIKKEAEAEQALMLTRGKVAAISKEVGTESALKNAEQFLERFNELQEKSKDEEVRRIKDQYAAYQDLVKRRLQLEQAFNQQLAILQKQRANMAEGKNRDTVDMEIKSVEQQQQALEEFYKHAGELGGQYNKELEDVFGRAVDPVQTWVTAATTLMDDGFFNIITGKFRDLEDVVVNFGNTMLKMLIQLATNKIFFSLFGGASGFSFVGGGGGLPGPEGILGHQGLYVRHAQSTSAGYGGKRGNLPFAGHYAQGGEVRAVLHEGEGVVNREGMRNLGVDNLNKLNSGKGVGGDSVVNNYYIQTIDERSFRDRLSEHGDIFSSASERSIQDNKSLRKTIQRFGT
jgi:hypothetical protein